MSRFIDVEVHAIAHIGQRVSDFSFNATLARDDFASELVAELRFRAQQLSRRSGQEATLTVISIYQFTPDGLHIDLRANELSE